MTDETHDMGDNESPTPPPEPMPVAHDDAAAVAGAGDFTSGEGLVAFAGIVIIAGWIIFEVIANEYYTTWVLLLAAVAVVLLPRVNRETVEKAHPLPVLMKGIGYAIAILAVFNLVEDLRFNSYEDLVSVLGALVLYAGGVMAFIGARQIKL